MIYGSYEAKPTPNYVERPDCHHQQVIMAIPARDNNDYRLRFIPELQEKVRNTPCEECKNTRAR